MTPLLYSFRRCPYAMRGRMGLWIAGLRPERDYQHREIILRDKPAHMLELSPKGTVPVFLTNDGRVIDESLDLLHYGLSLNDPEDWRGRHDAAGAQFIADNDGPFKHHLDRYKYASRYEDVPRGAVNLNHRQAAETYLAKLEQRLSTSPYLAGETRGLADIATFPFIRQFHNVEPEWWHGQDSSTPPFPHLKTWLQNHLDSDLFKSVMTKYPLWDAPSSPCH